MAIVLAPRVLRGDLPGRLFCSPIHPPVVSGRASAEEGASALGPLVVVEPSHDGDPVEDVGEDATQVGIVIPADDGVSELGETVGTDRAGLGVTICDFKLQSVQGCV